jgi:hypothetical protein
MHKLIPGAALALSLAFAGTAQADTVTTTFDGFADGSVNNKGGWLVDSKYDQSVVPVAGGKALRVSNAVTSSSFGDMLHSAPITKAAGENEANNVLVNEFTVKAPDTYVPGLFVTVSPDDGQGSRMSRLRLEDSADGVRVLFADATFTDQLIATLDRSVAHTIKFETTFVKGDDNDVVRIFIDDTEQMRGASWENYYREYEERNPSASDRLIIRTSGAAAPLTLGSGFLFDNVTTTSYHVNNPAPLNPPAPGPVGPQGPKGDTAATGVQGATGATGPAGANATNAVAAGANGAKVKIGATKRTLHVPSIKGMQLVGARASLRGKHLPVHSQSIKVDLRGKVVGNYNVSIVAKYKTKSGKVHTVRSIRSLSITIR